MQAIKQLVSTTMVSKIGNQEVLEQYCCMKCRKEVTVSRFVIPIGPRKGEVCTSSIGCDCELIEKVKASQREAKKAKLERLFDDNSLINESLKRANFMNFDRSVFNNEFMTAVNYVKQFDRQKPSNLFFQGTFGTGKSHLSVSIAKALRDRGYSTVFISTPKLLTKIRSTYNKNSDVEEEQVIKTLTNVDLVVFDDIGAEGVGDWATQKLFELIDQRAGKHNVFTTNLSSNEFESDKKLERLFSRMMESATVIVMKGDDYRRRHLKRGN